MDPVTSLVVGGLGYWIFTKVSKYLREQETADAESQRRRQEENEREEAARRAMEAERLARQRPYASAAECFEKEYISFSRLETYCSCPRKFKIVYLDRRKPSANEWLSGRGTVFHHIAEDLLRSDIGGRFKDKNISVLPKWNRRLAKELNLRDGIRFFTRTFPREPEIVAVEHKLTFVLNGLQFYGIVDAVVRHPNGTIELIDYKTGRNRWPWREQLEIYCIPFAKTAQAIPVTLRYMLIDRRCNYSWTVTQRQAQAVEAHILSCVNTVIADRSFDPVISSHCKNCGVREHCEFGATAYQGGYPQFQQPKIRLTRIRARAPRDKDSIYTESPEQTDSRGAKPKITKTSMKKRRPSAGKSFDLVVGAKDHICSHSHLPIPTGNYHFANHRGIRFEVWAFREFHPVACGEKLARFAAEHDYREFQVVKTSRNHVCWFCGEAIHAMQRHRGHAKWGRLHDSCFASLYDGVPR